MRYYIATGFDNKTAHNKLRDLLQPRGWKITYDWTKLERATPENARQIADAEVQGVLDAQFVFVILPGGCGTEFGIALGMRTPVLMIGDAEGFAQGAKYPIPCAFHHATGVECLVLPESPLSDAFIPILKDRWSLKDPLQKIDTLPTDPIRDPVPWGSITVLERRQVTDLIRVHTYLPSGIPNLDPANVTMQFEVASETGVDYVKQHFGIVPHVIDDEGNRTPGDYDRRSPLIKPCT